MRIIPVLVVALVLSGCTTTSDSLDTTTVRSAYSTASEAIVEEGSSTPGTVRMPPQISGFRVKQVQVGDRELTLAIADNPVLRSQGLMEVTDLEDLDGMLFFWRHDGGSFWMKNTVIPLDIVWFNEDGTFRDRASMIPCAEDPCNGYVPTGGLDFRYAIEARPGALDWITSATVITYVDD